MRLFGLGKTGSPGDGPEARLRAEIEAVTRERAALARLLAINRTLARTHDLSSILAVVMDVAIDLTGAERGFLVLDGHGGPRLETARNLEGRDVPAADREISRTVIQEVLATGAPLLSTNAEVDRRLRGSASVKNLRLRSILAAPVSIRGRAIGAIYVDHRARTHVFVPEDQAVLAALADQAAIAIQTALLVEENRRAREAVERRAGELAAALASEQDRAKGLEALLAAETPSGRIVGASPAMREVRRLLARYAVLREPVLLLGESGTGKELAARAIHDLSPRRARPFVGVNCAAIPEGLLESELFGHEKGAFTGAESAREGLLETASGGTLFLDEVGEIPAPLQAKLLRVLQDGEFRRVGGRAPRRADLRIVSATNRDLAGEVERDAFRRDLYYRLAVLQVTIPPLRDRREDIPELVEHILARLAARDGSRPRRVTSKALEVLVRHDWPGNVRELENELTRASALSGDAIDAEVLSESVARGRPAGAPGSLRAGVDDLERDAIARTLAATRGNMSAAARVLGLSREGLRKKMKRYGVRRVADGGDQARTDRSK